MAKAALSLPFRRLVHRFGFVPPVFTRQSDYPVTRTQHCTTHVPSLELSKHEGKTMLLQEKRGDAQDRGDGVTTLLGGRDGKQEKARRDSIAAHVP